MEHLASRLREHAEVFNPWDDPEPARLYQPVKHLPTHDQRIARWQEINMAIARGNQEMIDRSDTIVAVLDGVDVDSGTASEIGYGFGRGKLIYGLRTDIRQSGENEGSLVNLQVRYFIDASGGTVVTSADDLLATIVGER
jgi:nucleoside 2-deoxyribosyltransferase